MNFSVDRDVDIYLSTEFEFDQCTNKGDLLSDRHKQKHTHTETETDTLPQYRKGSNKRGSF